MYAFIITVHIRFRNRVLLYLSIRSVKKFKFYYVTKKQTKQKHEEITSKQGNITLKPLERQRSI